MGAVDQGVVWEAAPHHVPVVVRARIRDAVGYNPGYLLDLAGIIASRYRAAQAAGGHKVTAADGEECADYPLPLSKLRVGPLWLWAASCAVLPADGPINRPMLYRRNNVGWYTPYVEHPIPKYIHPITGPWRDVRNPTPTIAATHLTWYAHGDVDALRRTLSTVLWVGKRRHTGTGRILSWEVTQCDTPHPERWAYVQDGTIVRPVPIAAAEGWGVPYTPTPYAVRPPGWVPDRLTTLAGAPVPDLDIDF